MGLRSFLEQQFIDVIHWTEPDTGVLAYRFPMANMEIQSGAQLTDDIFRQTKYHGSFERELGRTDYSCFCA